MSDGPGDSVIERFLVVPGLGGSDAQHWQRIWTHDDPRFEVVKQDDWDQPQLDAWISRLDSAVHSSNRPAVLVAHSLGCHLVARWAAIGDTTPIRAALLVAPPDIEFAMTHGAAPVAVFAPTSSVFPFPIWLAASETDPWAHIAWSSQLARIWGANFVNLGDCGHVNSSRGHGPWQQGLDLLHQVYV